MPNEVTYNTYIKLMPTQALMAEAYKQMRKIGVRPDIYTFMPILNKSNSQDQLIFLLKEMQANNILPDKKLKRTLISKINPFRATFENLCTEYANKTQNSKWKQFWEELAQALHGKVQLNSVTTAKVTGYNKKKTTLYLSIEGELRPCSLHQSKLPPVNDLAQAYPIGHPLRVIAIEISDQYGINFAPAPEE
jgi:CTP synthase (UTP-ammonia lyase)